MDFSIIFKLRSKKIWWLDLIFYFAISLLVATILCYFVFIIKNNIQKQQIAEIETAMLSVGTQEQKEQEGEVLLYKKKISDFADLIKNHKFISNVFVFLENETVANVWFKQFSLGGKNDQIQLTGEAEDMDAFSRQTDIFENNEYVTKLDSLSSSLGTAGGVDFNLSLSVEPKIYAYIVNTKDKEPEQKTQEITSITSTISQVADLTEEEGVEEVVETEPQKNAEKLIYSFDIQANSEIVGAINYENHTILLDVPFSSDITNLIPSIIISEKAKVYPKSGTPQDFSNTISYIVTAEDGSTQEYLVTATITQSGKTEKGFVSTWVTIFLGIALSSFLVIVILIIFLIIKRRIKIK
jgi:hypothetical protein